MSPERWTPAAARRDLAVLFVCVLAGAWLAPLLPAGPRRVAVAAAGALGLAWLLLSLRRQRVSLRELGLGANGALRSIAVFLACAAATVAGFALAGGIDLGAPGRLADPGALGGYLAWALFQQLLVVAVLWRHARHVFGAAGSDRVMTGSNLGVAASAAAVFALVHAPNLRLMALVLAAELVWLLLFARFRSLLGLAAAHAVSALAAAEALQPHWLPTARVGLLYLQR